MRFIESIRRSAISSGGRNYLTHSSNIRVQSYRFSVCFALYEYVQLCSLGCASRKPNFEIHRSSIQGKLLCSPWLRQLVIPAEHWRCWIFFRYYNTCVASSWYVVYSFVEERISNLIYHRQIIKLSRIQTFRSILQFHVYRGENRRKFLAEMTL